jgi:hypothetical protein
MNSYEKIYETILEAFRKSNIGGVHPSHFTKEGLKTAKKEDDQKRKAAKKKTLLGIAVKKKEDSMSPEERLEYEEERDHQEMQDILKGKWR